MTRSPYRISSGGSSFHDFTSTSSGDGSIGRGSGSGSGSDSGSSSNPGKSTSQGGNIEEFRIQSNIGEGDVDLSAGVTEFNYYESVLSNHITATATIVETGNITDSNARSTQSIASSLDSLPIRGGERANIVIDDAHADEHKINFGGEQSLYVNRVRNAIPGTQKDVYFLDFASKEYFSNELTRVVKKYEGKISDNVGMILQEVLGTDANLDVDPTALPYNFIGCDRKPFYVCTWLASKAVPESSNTDSIGNAAGYLFYQTKDGFHFKSIDKLFSGTPYRKFVYNNTEKMPAGADAKILSYSIDRDIDLQKNLSLGVYFNRSIFFNPLSFVYEAVEYDINKQKEGVTIAGKDNDKDFVVVAEEFSSSPSRIMNNILDIGTLPSGVTSEKQLEEWKDDKENPNFKSAETLAQSIMRYNQLFTVQTNIQIPGDFSIRAGDLVECEFPYLKGGNADEVNPQSSGIYMVAKLCHQATAGGSVTSLGLVRDSFGKKKKEGIS